MASGLAITAPSGPKPPDEAVTSTIAQLLESMRFDHDRGTLEILGARVFYARASLVTNIMRELEGTIGPRAWEALKRAAETTGLEASRSWNGWGRLNMAKGILALRPFWSLLGLGVISMEAGEDDGHVTFRTPNSPWPEAYGNADHPICHITTGYAKGLVQGLGYRGVRCEERACRAMGHQLCEFELSYEAARGGPHAR